MKKNRLPSPAPKPNHKGVHKKEPVHQDNKTCCFISTSNEELRERQAL